MKKLILLLLIFLFIGCEQEPKYVFEYSNVYHQQKEQDITIGSIWIRLTDDPFEEPIIIKIVEKKQGWVKYYFVCGGRVLDCDDCGSSTTVIDLLIRYEKARKIK